MELDEARQLRCYSTLNLLRECTDKQVKDAYRKIISVAHPDHGGSHEEAQRVNQAKELLLNPTERADYDLTLVLYRLPDGLALDPDFDERIQRRKTKRHTHLEA